MNICKVLLKAVLAGRPLRIDYDFDYGFSRSDLVFCSNLVELWHYVCKIAVKVTGLGQIK